MVFNQMMVPAGVVSSARQFPNCGLRVMTQCAFLSAGFITVSSSHESAFWYGTLLERYALASVLAPTPYPHAHRTQPASQPLSTLLTMVDIQCVLFSSTSLIPVSLCCEPLPCSYTSLLLLLTTPRAHTTPQKQTVFPSPPSLVPS